MTIREVACRGRRSERGVLCGGESPRLVLVRRGAFIARSGAVEHVADPCTAMVVWDHAELWVRHPGDGGDDCTVIELDPRVAGDALGGLRRHRDVALPLPPRLQVAVAAFASAVRRARPSPHTEQAAIELVGDIVGSLAPCGATSHHMRRLAIAAIERIHRDLAINRSVPEIAEEIGCSPFHLMHAFRAEVGETVRAYRVRARLGAALHRLTEGGDDLAGLAVDLGFASHSHLTDTCVRALGLPPSRLRAQLQDPRAILPFGRAPGIRP